MRVSISAPGRFHYFDLAKQLARRQSLLQFSTGYPLWKINEDASEIGDKIYSLPWLHAPFMALQRLSWLIPSKINAALSHYDHVAFDRLVASKMQPCDVFVAISGCGLYSGTRATELGGSYVCDRGSSHITTQNKLLREEFQEWGIPFQGINSRTIEREVEEYDASDLITVPSRFSANSFVQLGISPSKIATIPYGVDLTKFYPDAPPPTRGTTLLFVGTFSLRKGVQYLLQAFDRVKSKTKKLKLIGHFDYALADHLKSKGVSYSGVEVIGPLPQHELRAHMSSAAALVLPSVEDGFGLVVTQALACGCPVIASEHTGAADMIEDGIDGFVVPARNVAALCDAIERAIESDSGFLRDAAIKKAKTFNGWDRYGEDIYRTYQKLAARNLR